MEKITVDEILSSWAAEYGGRWNAQSRPEALARLFATFIEQGYAKSEIKRAKSKVMGRLVSERSKFGAAALKEWHAKADRDFEDVFNLTFARVQLAEAAPDAIPKVAPKTEMHSMRDTLQEHLDANYGHTEIISDIQETDVTTDDSIKVFPELDRSRFSDIETSPILDFEEFEELVKRDQND